jgi:hypothetical protein
VASCCDGRRRDSDNCPRGLCLEAAAAAAGTCSSPG